MPQEARHTSPSSSDPMGSRVSPEQPCVVERAGMPQRRLQEGSGARKRRRRLPSPKTGSKVFTRRCTSNHQPEPCHHRRHTPDGRWPHAPNIRRSHQIWTPGPGLHRCRWSAPDNRQPLAPDGHRSHLAEQEAGARSASHRPLEPIEPTAGDAHEEPMRRRTARSRLTPLLRRSADHDPAPR